MIWHQMSMNWHLRRLRSLPGHLEMHIFESNLLFVQVFAAFAAIYSIAIRPSGSQANAALGAGKHRAHPQNFGMPFIPPIFFIIFIMPLPFIFFIMPCICSNSLSRRLTS